MPQSRHPYSIYINSPKNEVLPSCKISSSLFLKGFVTARERHSEFQGELGIYRTKQGVKNPCPQFPDGGNRKWVRLEKWRNQTGIHSLASFKTNISLPNPIFPFRSRSRIFGSQNLMRENRRERPEIGWQEVLTSQECSFSSCPSQKGLLLWLRATPGDQTASRPPGISLIGNVSQDPGIKRGFWSKKA